MGVLAQALCQRGPRTGGNSDLSTGRDIPAEDLRMRGQEGSAEQGTVASAQLRLYQVTLKHCSKLVALTIATSSGLAPLTDTSKQHLCVDTWPQPPPHCLGSCHQSLDSG